MMKLSIKKDGIQKCKETLIEVLKNGGLAIAPTDTQYGILCLYSNQPGVERIYRMKGRDSEKKLIALVSSLNMISTLCSKLPPDNLKKLWPSPLTVVLPAGSSHIYSWESQAVRMPEDNFLIELIAELGEPLFAPSANPQGKTPAVDSDEAYSYFGDEVELYIQGNIEEELEVKTAKENTSSTIIDARDNKLLLLRQGSFKIPGDILTP